MIHRFPQHSFGNPGRQQGIALFVALIFLVILTILGITALSNNTLQTRMAQGSAETNFAFQSADSALTYGESWLEQQTVIPLATCTASPCTDPVGIWPRAGLTTPPVTAVEIADDSWWTTNGRNYGWTYTYGATPAPIAGQALTGSYGNPTFSTPTFVVEDLGPDINNSLLLPPNNQLYYYQITARGFGSQSNSRTVVQSVYAKNY